MLDFYHLQHQVKLLLCRASWILEFDLAVSSMLDQKYRWLSAANCVIHWLTDTKVNTRVCVGVWVCGWLVLSDSNLRHDVSSPLTYRVLQPHNLSHSTAPQWDHSHTHTRTHLNTCRLSHICTITH